MSLWRNTLIQLSRWQSGDGVGARARPGGLSRGENRMLFDFSNILSR